MIKKLMSQSEAKDLTNKSKYDEGTLGFVRLQNRIVNAIQEACLSGVNQTTVYSTDHTLAVAAKRLFEEAGYTVFLKQGNGVKGENLIYLPKTYITVRWDV